MKDFNEMEPMDQMAFLILKHIRVRLDQLGEEMEIHGVSEFKKGMGYAYAHLINHITGILERPILGDIKR